MATDPRIVELRGRISAADRAVVERLNDRLKLVAELKRYKESHGLAFVDPDRERQMLEDLERANAGPLSDGGLREIFQAILDLTKREVGRS